MGLASYELEELWVDGWNELDRLLGSEGRVTLLTPEWNELSEDGAQGLIQDRAYRSEKVQFEMTWWKGQRALRLRFSPAT